MRFEGKTALVTGGSRGIGRACVAQLAAEGAKVAFVYQHNQPAAEQLVAELQGPGRKVRPCRPTSATAKRRQQLVDEPVGPSGSTSTCWSTRRASSATG